ncbi:MAG: IS66 family insertion sequence element accessory protein TnpB [Acidobacteriota bacterium]|nr:IS66 family insertion sequence element accessory protein TnpB [Acidobacteriota bacterium]
MDRLATLCRTRFDQDPFSGIVFLFRNRRATALKLLVYDGQGFWLCTKRFSRGRLAWWPQATGEALHPLAAHQLSVLLMNGHPDGARFQEPWRRLPSDARSTSVTPLASALDAQHTATAATRSGLAPPPARL